MSNKTSNKKLALIFAVLLVVALIFVFTNGKDERSFRTELVNIDTASVNEILITPKSNEGNDIKIYKENYEWKINLKSGKTVTCPESKIKNMLNTLIKIKPLRLAARGSEKWKEFEVDSSGTRVKILENGDVTLDIVLGRFSFQQPRTMNTFVRLYNDSDVYEAEGFLASSFNQDENSFRDNTVIKSDYTAWNKLTFSYPSDSSFTLTKFNNKWFANDDVTDSTKTMRYFQTLQRLTSTSFIDDIETASLNQPIYKLMIEDTTGSAISVNGYMKDSLYVINSSMNSESFFDGSKNGLGSKVFTGKTSLIK